MGGCATPAEYTLKPPPPLPPPLKLPLPPPPLKLPPKTPPNVGWGAIGGKETAPTGAAAASCVPAVLERFPSGGFTPSSAAPPPAPAHAPAAWAGLDLRDLFPATGAGAGAGAVGPASPIKSAAMYGLMDSARHAIYSILNRRCPESNGIL